jgi:hypothetical protein
VTADKPTRWSDADILARSRRFALECGCTTLGEPCAEHQRRIEAAEYEREYGPSDPDWDR